MSFYAILFQELEHPQVGAFVDQEGTRNQSPVDTEGQLKYLGSRKVYAGFQLLKGQGSGWRQLP